MPIIKPSHYRPVHKNESNFDHPHKNQVNSEPYTEIKSISISYTEIKLISTTHKKKVTFDSHTTKPNHFQAVHKTQVNFDYPHKN